MANSLSFQKKIVRNFCQSFCFSQQLSVVINRRTSKLCRRVIKIRDKLSEQAILFFVFHTDMQTQKHTDKHNDYAFVSLMRNFSY